MTKEQQLAKFDEFSSRMRELIITKGDDYSGDNRLALFYDVSDFLKVGSADILLIQMAIKLKRLSTLAGASFVNNESMDDNCIDLANYAFLMYCL